MSLRADWAAVIVAAGRGQRFGRPKQFLEIAGLPMVGWSIRTFAAMTEVADVVIVTEAPWLARMRYLAERLAPARTIRVVEGGAMRQDSVRCGLLAVPERCNAVLVHDGARPMIHPADVRAAMNEVRDGRASLLAGRVVDTIKMVDPASSIVVGTLPRETLWAAQTPQCALASDLRRAHARAESDGIQTTDDAALLERIGIEVVIVPSAHSNFKVTVPEDIERAHALLSERASTVVLEA